MTTTKQLLILMFTAFLTPCAAQGYTNQTLQYDGLTRQYSIYVPASYDGTVEFPLLFNFHGGNDVIASWQTLSDMRSLADAENFIVVYPQARPDHSDGNSFNWLPKSAGTFDDVPFISALIDAIAVDYQINQSRIYACGYSLGGEFAYELSCKLNNRIAAIAAVARTMQANPNSYCAPVHPTGVLTILGTNDSTSPYNGLTYAGIEYYLSAAATHNYWATYNNCETTASMSTVSSSVERHTWSTEAGCAYVEELKVIGGGHDWPGSFGNMTIDTNSEIWQFVSNYNINGLIECTTASVNDFSSHQGKYKAYPNPVNSQLTIEMDIAEEKEYRIYSTVGKLLISGTLNSKTNKIDLSSLPYNVYFLKINNQTMKFVKAE
jgi:polyhydroxybutyrate depolymerase